MNWSVILAVGATLLTAYSQILLKKSCFEEHTSQIEEYLNKYVILGYVLMLVATILNVLSYRKIDYMLGNIINCLAYVIVIVLANIVLKEKISLQKWIGIILVLIGIIVYNI